MKYADPIYAVTITVSTALSVVLAIAGASQ